MTGVTKAHDKKVVLKDIYLSYFYGAKIGVLGLNGSGKSSLLKILGRRRQAVRGADQPRAGVHDRVPGAGAAPDGGQDRQAVRRGGGGADAGAAGRVRADQRKVRRADGRRRDDGPAGEAGGRAGKAGRGQRLGPGRAAGDGDGRPAVPAGGRRRGQPVRRRAAARRPRAAAADQAGRADPGRADEPLGRRDGRVAGAAPQAVRGDGHRGHPRLPATSWTETWPGWILELDRGHGIPTKGNYTAYLEAKKARMEIEEKQASARQKSAGPGAGVGPPGGQGPGRQEQGPAGQVRGDGQPGPAGDGEAGRDLHPARPALGRAGDHGREADQGVRRQAAAERRRLRPAAQRHRRHHRAQRGGQERRSSAW